MSSHEQAESLQSVLKRLEAVEERLDEISEFGLGSNCRCSGDTGVWAQIREPGTNVIGNYITLTWGSGTTCNAMEHISSWLRVYDTGAFESSTTLKDRSRSSKFANWFEFHLIIKSSGARICPMGQFSANFGPGEEKTYSTSGSSGCAKDNYKLLVDGTASAIFHWECHKR